jgi:hypothetical protein
MAKVDERDVVGGILTDTALQTCGLRLSQVAWPNRDFDKPTDKPWARVTIKSGTAIRLEIGKSRVLGSVATRRFPGVVIIQVFTALDTGDGKGADISDKVAKLFEDVDIDFGVGSMRFKLPTVTDDGGDGYYNCHRITVPFLRDEVY